MLYCLEGSQLSTPPEGQYFVADNASMIGRVYLAAGSSVWFNAVLRGDVEDIVIGARSNIQDASMLHADPGYPMTVGEGVTVGIRRCCMDARSGTIA